MRMTVTTIHIIAGGLGLLSGFVALFAAKGARLHRRSGMLFVYAMLTMALLGATIAASWRVAWEGNVPIGLLTAYLVATALTTVRPHPTRSHQLDLGLMLIALAICAALFTFGFMAMAAPKGTLHGFPSPPFFIFGSIALLALVGDVRLIRSGGVRVIRGTPRLVRHLWRMNTALLIAAFSFFIGQAKVVPKAIRIYPLLAVPPLVVFAAMMYWLWRVRSKRSSRVAVEIDAREAA